MKNLYLLPTQNNNSKLASYTYDESNDIKVGEIGLKLDNSSGWSNCWSPRELYIVSDEEIKSGDWMHYKHFGEDIVTKYNNWGGLNTNVNEHKDYYKKIILTTDPELIKDSVQKIDDDFLQWFIHNSSCERVDVDKYSYRVCNFKDDICYCHTEIDQELCKHFIKEYKIIIPSEVDNLELGQIISKQHKCLDCNKLISDCSCIEEIVEFPKQEQKQHLIDIMKDDEELGIYEETVEEAAQSYAKTVSQNPTSHMLGFINGVKWAQEKSYSEKDLKEAYMVGKHGGVTQTYYEFEDFIKQFKKK